MSQSCRPKTNCYHRFGQDSINLETNGVIDCAIDRPLSRLAANPETFSRCVRPSRPHVRGIEMIAKKRPRFVFPSRTLGLLTLILAFHLSGVSISSFLRTDTPCFLKAVNSTHSQIGIRHSSSCWGQDFLKPALVSGSDISGGQRWDGESGGLVSDPSSLGSETKAVYASYSQVDLLRQDSTLRAVAFGTQTTGIACGDRGIILRTTDGGTSWDTINNQHQCTFTDITWTGPQQAVIVGGSIDRITGISRGVVIWTRDAGASWSSADDAELPMLWQVEWDGKKVITSGDWSDSLLTNRFESYDRGASWHAGMESEESTSQASLSRADQLRWRVATNQLITVRDACRTSEQGRCLVGDHGVIAMTEDAGQTWKMVRGDQRKTAVLFIARSPASVAWSLVGSEALEERHRVNILCETISNRGPTDLNFLNHPYKLHRARQAAINSGAASLEEMQRDQKLDVSALAKQWIAIHEPSVLVLDQTIPPDLKEAFITAGISRKIKRVVEYSFCDPENASRHGTLMHRNALLSKTGILASDLQVDAMHWIAPHQAKCFSVQTHSLYDVATTGARGESLMNGLSIKQGERLDSQTPDTSRRKLQIARARIQRDSQIEQLIDRTASSEHFQRLLNHLIASTSKEDRFRLIWDIVERTGDKITDHTSLEKHEAALRTCVERFPELTLSDWATLRIETIRNSVEWRRLRSTLPDHPTRSNHPYGTSEIVVSPFQQSPSEVQQASVIAPINPKVSPVVVPRLESDAANQPIAVVPSTDLDLRWEFHPLVLLSREAARLRNDNGDLEMAAKVSPNLVRLGESNAGWREVLGNNGKQSLIVHPTPQPPHLDGQLDDSCWKSPIRLRDDTSVRISHDDEYLYLGISVPKNLLNAEDQNLADSASHRDQPLEPFDRLKICIDTDCDLLSSMQLQVTATGRVHDAIDGCETWQPTWYPAIAKDSTMITFEIAILRRDLTDLPITPSEQWFISVSSIRGGQNSKIEIIPQPYHWLRATFE